MYQQICLRLSLCSDSAVSFAQGLGIINILANIAYYQARISQLRVILIGLEESDLVQLTGGRNLLSLIEKPLTDVAITSLQYLNEGKVPLKVHQLIGKTPALRRTIFTSEGIFVVGLNTFVADILSGFRPTFRVKSTNI